MHWNERNGKWAAGIKVKYRQIDLGLFTNITEAAAAYEEAAHRYYGEFARPERYKRQHVDLKALGLV